MATPTAGSDYSEYVGVTVGFSFDVNKFAKKQVPVDVLCFLPEEYTNFGFDWFIVTQTVVREKCFFGDICLNGAPYSPADYDGSLYGSSLGVDVPAIMKIVVKKNGVEVPNSPFNNEASQGIGSPLCVQYPDDIGAPGEIFTFDLYIWTRLCDGSFDYELFDTFTATDDGALNIPVGADGVLDYVVGTCNSSDADVTYGHYQWLVTRDFYDKTNPTGFLFTDDATTGKIYKWFRSSTAGYGNISSPIGRFLYYAGYQPEGLLGLEANYYNCNTELWSANLSALMFAYNITGGGKYMTQANNIMLAVIAKYSPIGTSPARTLYWGYDYFNYLTGAKMAMDNGVTGAAAYYNILEADYLTNYVTKATDGYQRIFINAIAAQLGIGTFQGSVEWSAIKADNDAGGYQSLQEGAYGLMGNSWADPSVVKEYIKANICVGNVSEAEAEAIYAIGL